MEETNNVIIATALHIMMMKVILAAGRKFRKYDINEAILMYHQVKDNS